MISIVNRKKPREVLYLRAVPDTAYNPTVPQILARLKFAELASKARGKKFIGELPPAAEEVRKMSGERFGKTVKQKKWERILKELLKEEERVEIYAIK